MTHWLSLPLKPAGLLDPFHSAYLLTLGYILFAFTFIKLSWKHKRIKTYTSFYTVTDFFSAQQEIKGKANSLVKYFRKKSNLFLHQLLDISEQFTQTHCHLRWSATNLTRILCYAIVKPLYQLLRVYSVSSISDTCEWKGCTDQTDLHVWNTFCVIQLGHNFLFSHIPNNH